MWKSEKSLALVGNRTTNPLPSSIQPVALPVELTQKHRIVGLPQIHEQRVPLSSTVSTIGATTYNLAKHWALILTKDSTDFVRTLGYLYVGLQDVVSLFTRVPIRETVSLLSPYFEALPPCPDGFAGP
jgi:hypothetical protein